MGFAFLNGGLHPVSSRVLFEKCLQKPDYKKKDEHCYTRDVSWCICARST